MLDAIPSLGRMGSLVGGSLPEIRQDARLPGLTGYVTWPGRYAYNMVRRQIDQGIATHTSVWPPYVLPSQTPYGWGASSFFSQYRFAVSGNMSQSAHSTEVVVYWGATPPSGVYASFVSRGLNGGLAVAKSTANKFSCTVYDADGFKEVVGTTVVQSGTLYVVHSILCENTLRLYVNGVEEGNIAVSGALGFFYPELWIGNGGDDSVARILSVANANDVAWPIGLIVERARNPWSALEWPEDLLIPAALPVVAISGTASATLGNVTAAATATLALAGSTSATLGSVTSAATGALAISGTASATLGNVTAAATATLALAGSTSATLGSVTSAATGALAISGALGVTLDAITLAAMGSGAGTGYLSATLGAVTLSATATIALRASTSTTLADAIVAATGALQLRATSSVTLANSTLYATGTNANVTNVIVLVWNGVRI